MNRICLSKRACEWEMTDPPSLVGRSHHEVESFNVSVKVTVLWTSRKITKLDNAFPLELLGKDGTYPDFDKPSGFFSPFSLPKSPIVEPVRGQLSPPTAWPRAPVKLHRSSNGFIPLLFKKTMSSKKLCTIAAEKGIPIFIISDG